MNTFTRGPTDGTGRTCDLVLPHTEAIKPEGWHLLAIFTATIVGFILRPLANRYYGTLWYCCGCSNKFYYHGASIRWLRRG